MIGHLEVSHVIPIVARRRRRRSHSQRSAAPVPCLAARKTSQYGVLKETTDVASSQERAQANGDYRRSWFRPSRAAHQLGHERIGKLVSRDADQADSDFSATLLAMAGHDLRQPLQVITSAHDVLAQTIACNE